MYYSRLHPKYLARAKRTRRSPVGMSELGISPMRLSLIRAEHEVGESLPMSFATLANINSTSNASGRRHLGSPDRRHCGRKAVAL